MSGDQDPVEPALAALREVEVRPDHTEAAVRRALLRNRSPDPSPRLRWARFALAAALLLLALPFFATEPADESQAPALVRLAGGVLLQQDQASRLSLFDAGPTLRVELEAGRVALRLMGDRRERVVQVVAGPVRVEANGTVFSVEREGDEVEVLVTEGAVKVFSRGESLGLEAPRRWTVDGPTALSVAPAGLALLAEEVWVEPLQAESSQPEAIGPEAIGPEPETEPKPETEAEPEQGPEASAKQATSIKRAPHRAQASGEASPSGLRARRRNRRAPSESRSLPTDAAPDPTPNPPRASTPSEEPAAAPQARYQAARSQARAGQGQAALRALRTLAQEAHPIWSPLAHLERIRLHAQLGEAAQAVDAAEAFLQSHPEHPLAPEAQSILCRLDPEHEDCS
ncbi:MAG: FecR domain-containing protein [Myxococcota bacterium]